jgi:hypothetical protein
MSGDLALDRTGSPHISYDYRYGDGNNEDLRFATRSAEGHFFLSSEDYLYSMGLTPFGQDYLGILTYTNDVGETYLAGNPGTPSATAWAPIPWGCPRAVPAPCGPTT